MSSLSRMKRLAIALAALLLGGISLFAGYGWLQEHDARLKAESTTAVQEKQIGSLKQQEQDTQDELVRKLSALEREKKQTETPSQFVADATSLLPDLPKPIEVRAVVTDPALPGSSTTQEVVLPNEDLTPIRDYEVSCQENSLKLTACNSIQAGLEKQIALTQSQRDDWKKAARGGSFWHRTIAAAKWFAVGAGSGAAAYAITRHK